MIDTRVDRFGYDVEAHLNARVRFHFLFPSSGPNVHEWLEEIVGPHFKNSGWVLDVGAGLGVFWQTFLPRWKGPATKTILCDLSPAMISALRKIVDPDVFVVLGDLDRLPFRRASFDLVLCHSALHYSHRALEAVTNLRGLLTSTGTLSILVPGIENMREMHDFFVDGGYGIDLGSRPLMSFTETEGDKLIPSPFNARKLIHSTTIYVSSSEAVASYFLSHPQVGRSPEAEHIRCDLMKRLSDVIALRGRFEVTRQYCLYLLGPAS